MPSCKNCVNFIETSQFGVPICAHYGKLLGKNSADERVNGAIALHIGTKCGSFQEHTEGVTHRKVDIDKDVVIAPIGVPAPEVMDRRLKIMNGDIPRKQPMACSRCEFFIMPTAAEFLGFTNGICSARGLVLPSTAHLREAKSCMFGNDGAPRTSTAGFMLHEDYDDKVVIASVAAAVRAGAATGTFNPYKFTGDHWTVTSDKTVTEQDAANGIRAWRKIEDPDNYGPALYLPVFDVAKLGYTEQFVKATYSSHTPELYIDHHGLLYTWTALALGGIGGNPGYDKVLALFGDAGTGKTEFWCFVASLMNLPFVRISGRPDTDRFEMVGQDVLVKDGDTAVTEWENGIFTHWYQNACVICVDEPTAWPTEVWYLLRSAFDAAKNIMIAEKRKVIEPHAYCFVGMAMNPSWKPEYRGTKPLSSADNDRLFAQVVELPDEDMEKDIIRRHCEHEGYDLPEPTLEKIMGVAKDVRAMIASGDLPMAWGIRTQVKVALMTQFCRLTKAYQVAVLSAMDPQTAELIAASVKSYDTSF